MKRTVAVLLGGRFPILKIMALPSAEIRGFGMLAAFKVADSFLNLNPAGSL